MDPGTAEMLHAPTGKNAGKYHIEGMHQNVVCQKQQQKCLRGPNMKNLKWNTGAYTSHLPGNPQRLN